MSYKRYLWRNKSVSLNRYDYETEHYCVILAGGKGRRLWPCSRDKHPKQFIDFFGMGRTQLQQTFDRFAQVLPKENIYINNKLRLSRLD